LRLTFAETHNFLSERVRWADVIEDRPYPEIPVVLANGSQSFSTIALLDTGADACLFHGDFARNIGLVVEEGRWEPLGGINPNPDSDIDTYVHTIDLTVGHSFTLRCEVAFSDEITNEPSDQLIGRHVVFDALRFAIRQRALKVYIGREP
jgi:hypothetical protein